MKKIIAIVVAIVMIAAMAVPAFAAKYSDDVVNNAGGTVIKYGSLQAYEVVVPGETTINAAQPVEAKLAVQNYTISTTKVLTISISSENANTDGENDTWQLVEVAPAEGDKTGAAPVPYAITVASQAVTPKSPVALTLKTATGENGAKGEKVESTLVFTTPGTSQVASFEDYITFSVLIDDIAKD